MKLFQIVFKKEIVRLLSSSFVYFLAAIFAGIVGLLFFNNLLSLKGSAEGEFISLLYRPIFGTINFLLMIMAPFLSMGTLSQEEREGTLAYLLTSKLTFSHILLAKILSTTCALFMLGSTIVVPATVLAIFGLSDWVLFFSCLMGTFLNCLCFSAVGVFSSAMSKSSLVAVFMSFFILFGIYLFPYTASVLSNQFVANIFFYLGLAEHFNAFTVGLIRSSDIVYFATFSLFFFQLSKQVMQIRWNTHERH